MSATTTIKTLIINAGQTAVLKSGVQILSVTKDGDVTATSTCTSVQTAIDDADTMACYRILFVGEQDAGGGSGPFRVDNGDLKIAAIGIGDELFSLDNFQLNGWSSNETRSDAFVTKINDALTSKPVLRPHSMLDTGETGERAQFNFIFSVPETLGPTVYLKITTPASGDPSAVIARFYAETCADCCPTTSG